MYLFKLTHQTNLENIKALLHKWLSKQLTQKAFTWAEDMVKAIQEEGYGKCFISSFAQISRRTGKEPIHLATTEIIEAQSLRKNWEPDKWLIDQVLRTLMLLSLNRDDEENYVQTLETIFSNADMSELIALYQSLPLLPYPERWRTIAIEGVRSNIIPVFNAMALNNPYPNEYFDIDTWNRFILKAVFVGSPLHRITGLNARINAPLKLQLKDYLYEKSSAKRDPHPEVAPLIG